MKSENPSWFNAWVELKVDIYDAAIIINFSRTDSRKTINVLWTCYLYIASILFLNLDAISLLNVCSLTWQTFYYPSYPQVINPHQSPHHPELSLKQTFNLTQNCIPCEDVRHCVVSLQFAKVSCNTNSQRSSFLYPRDCLVNFLNFLAKRNNENAPPVGGRIIWKFSKNSLCCRSHQKVFLTANNELRRK